MARLITVAVASKDKPYSHHILGSFTQALKAWEALLSLEYPETVELRAPGAKALSMGYQQLANRLRDYGMADIYSEAGPDGRLLARLWMYEINEIRDAPYKAADPGRSFVVEAPQGSTEENPFATMEASE